MKPLLKWAGSKRWQVEMLRPYVGEALRFVELFAGSAALTFGLERREALLNDTNPHLMNFYRHAQRQLVFDLDMTDSEANFYDYRAMFNNRVRQGKALEARTAQLFYYLNHHCFNGLWRVNQAGVFNVPYAAGRNAPEQDWLAVARFLEHMTLSNEDYMQVLLRPDDFVYADPPYDSTFTDYTEDGWSFLDLESLVNVLMDHPGRVVIMNAATDRVVQHLQWAGFSLYPVQSGQRMQQSQGRTDVVPEVMACNFPLTYSPDLTMMGHE